MGVNRLSIGLQSSDNSQLEHLGRLHTFEEFLYGYNIAVDKGFSNIIDMMTALPNYDISKSICDLEK